MPWPSVPAPPVVKPKLASVSIIIPQDCMAVYKGVFFDEVDFAMEKSKQDVVNALHPG